VILEPLVAVKCKSNLKMLRKPMGYVHGKTLILCRFALEVGQMSLPVSSDSGIHIIYRYT
jgi:hypothetical protein